MPLEFIPNQPFIFEKPIGDYPCLNNDPKAYAQLVQDGDITCVQWILDACDEPMCESDMVMETPGSDELGSWTVSDGWSTTGSDNLSYAGPDSLTASAAQTFTAIENAIYKLSFKVQNYTGTSSIFVLIGSNTYIAKTIEGDGDYSVYFTAYETPIQVAFTVILTTISDTWEIVDIELNQWTDCWQDEAPDDLPTWSYTFDGANGKFCSLVTDSGDLINTTAFTTTGNYHGVTMVIDSCTQGGLEVYLGSVLLGTTSGNGSFEFYGTPTAGTDLVFTKTDNFNGCVSQVNVKDYGDVSTATVTVRSDNNFYKADGLTPTAFNDRLVQCIDWENLDWNMNGIPGDCIPLRVDIKDPCDNDVLYISVNRALLKSGGATWDCTKLVESWNDGYAFGFYFGDIASPDFKLTQRLRVLAFNPVYRNAGEEYLYSSGNTGRSFAQSQKARTAWFDYMDEYAHDCTRTQLLGQKLFIEGYAFYYPTEDYEPEWNENGRYNLAQSRVTVFHEEAIFGSACGVMANTICPPQVVQLPPNITQVQVLMDEYDAIAVDLTDVFYSELQWDSAGVNLGGGGGGAFDLTSAIDRASFATSIANTINVVFGTSTTSVSCTVSGTLLSLNIICDGTIVLPMPSLSIAISDSTGNNFAIPFYYS